MTSRALTMANLQYLADRLTDEKLADLERCARALLDGKPGTALAVLAADRNRWKKEAEKK